MRNEGFLFPGAVLDVRKKKLAAVDRNSNRSNSLDSTLDWVFQIIRVHASPDSPISSPSITRKVSGGVGKAV